MFPIFALSILSYLLGSIPFGYLIGRWHGRDIRQEGSGNIGATNIGRVLGWKWGLLTFLADGAKGFVAVSLAGLLLHDPKVGFYILAGGLAILGHYKPVWLSWHGGKVVATSLGVFLGIMPWWLIVVALFTFLVTLWLSKYVSLGSICAAVAAAFSKIIFGGGFNQDSFELTIFIVVAAALIIFAHKQNIRRILDGTEHKIQLPHSP